MQQLEFHAADLAATDRLGAALADIVPDGSVIGLVGTLGAGKTRLVQAIATACGVPRAAVSSPTFVLCHEYHGRRLIYHLDAYRLSGPEQFLQLGPEEMFAAPALTIIEWADRVAGCLPSDYWEIEIRIAPDDGRDFMIRVNNATPDLETLRDRLSPGAEQGPAQSSPR